MARGTALSVLRSMLKTEIGDFGSTNTTRDSELNALLSNWQKKLGIEHYWPFLEQDWDVSAPAGTQFITLPTVTAGLPAVDTVAINLDQLPTVRTLFNNQYLPVINGIGPEEYNTMNIAFGQQSDPIQRWRLATNPNEPSNPNKFEVWPVPATTQTIRFTGERAIQVLASDNDTADLDDMLIVLFTAADKAAKSKQADAVLKLNQAKSILQRLRQGYETRSVRRTMDGQGDADFKRRVQVVGIRVAVH